ncbi:Reticulon-domain-containing protein [Terfezia claveryi]|nr:Reticulon-domain-containing protein [Terfezia claveryi]
MDYNTPQQDVKSDLTASAKNVVNGTEQDFRGLHESSNQEIRETPLTHFHSFFYDLVTWKYPRASALIFISLLSTILAFRFVNVMRYVFKAAYLLLGSVAALEYAGKHLGYKGVVSQMRPRRYYTIPRENIESLFEEIHDFLNFVVVEFQRVVFVENLFTTVAAFVASFFGYFLIKYLPFWSLAFLGTILGFAGPYVYINNQEQIDAQINHYSDIANMKLIEARGVTEQYAGEYATRARQTASQLSEKVQSYTNRRVSGEQPRPNFKPHDFPNAPTQEPVSPPQYQEHRAPILA